MSGPRRLASSLLRRVFHHSSSDSHDWARAMLRELDFIESDWAALFWALGSTAALFGHSGRHFWVRFGSPRKAEPMNSAGRRALGPASGVAIAGMLALCVFGLPLLSFHFFPSTVHDRIPWLAWLIAIGLPMTVFIVAAIALWQKRRSLAVGILLSATALGTHFALAVAIHRNYQ